MAGSQVVTQSLVGVASVTPSAVQTQAGGTVIGNMINNITAGAANDAITLPPAGPSTLVVLINAANAKNLFPPLGGAINGGTVNAVLSITASKVALAWYTTELNVTVVQLA